MNRLFAVAIVLQVAICHGVKSQVINSVVENELNFRSLQESKEVEDKPMKIIKIIPKQTTVPTAPTTTGNSTTGQTQVTATRQGPCQCANGLCGCCSRILLSTFRQKACVNVTYDPDDFRFTANIIMNDRILYTRSISGKNPSPLCVPVPRIPVVRACVRFYNIFFQGRNVHACVNMEGKFQDTTLFKVGLDCLRLGSEGVAVVKPEDGGGLGVQFLPGDEDDDDNDDSDNDEYDGDDADDDDDDDDDDDGLFDYK